MKSATKSVNGYPIKCVAPEMCKKQNADYTCKIDIFSRLALVF